MQPIRKLKFILLLPVLCCRLVAAGQTFSYLYIQGDKETPIYVKMEDEMQPRYGKNYCIISQLAPGPIHVQVLFQQNVYPPQNFLLQVPENGYRGFIVTHKGDNFALYDLQQKIYIPAGNSMADGPAAPALNTTTPMPAAATISTGTAPAMAITPVVPVENMPDAPEPAAPEVKPVTPSKKEIALRKARIDSLIAANNKKAKATPSPPQFIDNMVLDNERTPQNGTYTLVTTGEPQPVITNSDCPTPLDNNVFEDIYMKMSEKQGEERFKYLQQNNKHCFSCNQAQILAKGLSNDQQRYGFLKQIYPRITDQGNFRSLQNLFTTAEWKSYFQLITP